MLLKDLYREKGNVIEARKHSITGEATLMQYEETETRTREETHQTTLKQSEETETLERRRETLDYVNCLKQQRKH